MGKRRKKIILGKDSKQTVFMPANLNFTALGRMMLSLRLLSLPRPDPVLAAVQEPEEASLLPRAQDTLWV